MMLITTKLQRPQVAPDLLPRPRLYAALDQARVGKLTLVCAPAGYGKSSLVASWLESAEHTNVWISLDRSDSDLDQFLGYLVGSLRLALTDSYTRSATIPQSATPPPLDFIVANLVNDLAELESPLIIVLDDFHFIENDEISELISRLLQYLPHQIHLVIITREDPNLPLVQMRAKRQMTDIRMGQLRFTEEEATLFLKHTIGDLPVVVTPRQVAAKTEGWPVGLRLAALSVHESVMRTGQGAHAKAIDDGLVMDYLVAEVLMQAEPGTRDFMLRTALCDRLCVELCQVLMGEDTPVQTVQARIESLTRTNLFVVQLDGRGDWWRYHHLFQELLQHQLHQQYSDDEICDLHVIAGKWYAAHGFLDEAFTHYLAAEDMAAAVALIEHNRYAMMASDRWHAVERWLARLPEALKRTQPALLMAQAWIAYYHHRLRAIPPLLQSLSEHMTAESNLDALHAEAEFFRGCELFWRGETAQALAQLERCLVRLPTDAVQVREETEIYRYLALQALGRKEVAFRLLNDDLYGPENPSPIHKTRLLVAAAFLHLLGGDLDGLHEASSQLLKVARATDNPDAEAWANYLLAFYHFSRNQCAEAQHNFACAVAQRYGVYTRAAVDSMAGLAMTELAQGDDAEAETTLALLQEFAATTGELTYVTIARTAQARARLRQGRLDAARRRIQTTPLEADTGILFFFLEIPRITACRIQIAGRKQSEIRQCIMNLEELRAAAMQNHNVRQLIEIEVLLALAYRTLKQHEQAQTALNRALDLAAPGGWIRPFFEVGSDMADFLREQSSRHRQRDFIARLLAAFTTPAKRATQPVGAEIPDLLTDRETDVLRLLAQHMSNQEIAAELVISLATVKRYTANIYQKLHVNNRRQAVAKAREIGQLPTP